MKLIKFRISRVLFFSILLLNYFSVIKAIPPSLADPFATEVTFTEGSLPVIVTSTIFVNDPDGMSTLSYAIVKITNGFNKDEDNLLSTYGIYTSETGELYITGPTTDSEYQDIFRYVRYQNLNDFNPTTDKRRVTFTIYDEPEISNTINRVVNIAAVNDRPQVINPGAPTFDYTEGSAAVNILPDVEITDDDINLSQATITISEVTSDDLLSVSGIGMSHSYNPSTGTLTISGSATVAAYQTALRSVKYLNINTNDPKEGQRGITYTVKDNTLESLDNSVTVNVIGVNDAPVLGGANGTITYNEGDPETVVANTITVEDIDNTTLSSASVSISGYITGEDRLSVVVSSPLISSFSSATGILTISGAGTPLQYQTALRNVTYRNLNDTTPNTSTRTINYQVYDGVAFSNTVSQFVLVYAVNDVPTPIDDVYSGVDEGGTLTVTAANGVLINDKDPDGPSALTALKISNPLYGTLTLNANGSFTYVHNGSENLVDGFTYRAFDSQVLSTIATVQITMSEVNDEPILSGIETIPIIFTEGNAATTISSAISVADSDDLNLTSAIIQITTNYLSTEDSLYYTSVGPTVVYSKVNGSITLTGSYPVNTYQTFLRSIKYKNYNQNNPSILPRTISFTVNDGKQNSNTQARLININAVNDSCIATNVAISGTNFYVNDHLKITYTYTDPDGDAQGIPTLRWYSSAYASGIGMTIIPGVVTDTFTVRNSDAGKYIGAIVRPIDNKGLHGIADTSVFHYMNAAPIFTDSTVQNLVHPGSYAVGETVTAHFVYFDKESNAAGTHEYQWYRSSGSWDDAIAISGATTPTYVIKNADKNNFIALRVRPLATSGSSPGRYFRSMWYSVSLLPSASFTGADVDSICNDGTSKGTLLVSLTSSNLPVSFVYQRNSSTPVTISVSNIANPYPLEVSDTGTYKLISVSDNKYAYGTRLDTIGKIKYFPKPRAILTPDSIKICSNDNATYNVLVALQGKAPWSLTYMRNGVAADPITNISASPYNIPVTILVPGTYTVSNVTDANGCPATGTGKTVVMVKTDPIATISGNYSICPYSNAPISVALTGTSPWRLFYTINDGAEIQVTNINQDAYTLNKSNAGTYKITRVFDANNKEGCVSGTANVTHYPIPTASITGSHSTCEGISTTIDVQLTGTANWQFSYSHNGTNPVTMTEIGQSTYPLTLSEQGNYTLNTVSDAHCQGTVAGTASLSIIKAPGVDISMATTDFTKDSDPIRIVSSPEGGLYSDSDKPKAIITDDDNFIFFYPALAGTKDSPHMIRYKYQKPETQCWGYDSIQVWVLSDSSEILLVNSELNTKTTLCFNYDSLLIVGKYINSAGKAFGNFTITGSQAAIENLDSNKAYLYPSKILPGNNAVTVTFHYKVGIDDKQIIRDFKFENINSDFNWDHDCFNGTTRVYFTDQSEIGDTTSTIIEHYQWKINSNEYDASKLYVYFSSQSTYPIEHTIVSKNGCFSTTKKDLVFLPTYNPKAKDYYEDFSDGASNWKSNTIESYSVNTWKLGKPWGETFGAAPEGTVAWYTKVENVNEAEYSYVTSPCFNFWDAERPMIKMNIWRAFTDAENIDGAVLQYWTPETNDWKPIGTVDDGIYWYNSLSIEGSPGMQPSGWTSSGQNSQDTSWVECRHALDFLRNKARVKFRIAYGTKKYNFERDGFAFDDIWIGERKKRVVMEHFTNAGSEACKNANSTLNQIVNKNAKDVIDLQYHMDLPGADPFNLLNPVPAYSRSYYYDLPDVPYSIMNGGVSSSNRFDFDDNTPEEKDIKLSVLKDNKFYVKGHAIYAGDVLAVDIDIKALEFISQRPITLYVAIVENEIKGITGDNGETIFESVVHDLIPYKTYNNSWEVGPTEHIDLDWDIENIFDLQELRVITFLQDEITQEIYQASIDNPNTETGIKENFNKADRNFLIYPNPTLGRTSIQWKNPLEKDSRMEITDNLGRVVWQGTMSAGEQVKIISLEGLDAGTYTFRTILNDKTFESQKIILLSNN